MNNNINLNLYKIFYDVARFGSFSSAANYTYSTQPAISKAIKKLEEELGCKLFYRKSNGVELTEKGRELLYYVEKSYGNILTAERILLETEDLNRGKLSIGISSNLYCFIFDGLKKFHNDYPNIEITVLTGNTSYLLDKLETHSIDFIIDTSPVIDYYQDITINKLKDINYCFISNKDEKIKSLKDLEDKDILLPIINTSNRNILDEYLLKNNITLNKVINLHTSELILKSVKEGLGIGYILYDYVKEDKDIKILDIKNLPKTEIVLIYNKKFLTHAPLKFINDYLDMN